MNYLLVSPNFPGSQEYFAKSLKEKGINVLGVGSENYDNLSQGLKESLTEYFKVDSLENYEEVFRAVAFLSYKHGKIDRIESNNEYWLELDAKLREDFNIFGVKPSELELTKYKSKMKSSFKKAGVKVAEGFAASNKEELDKVLKKLTLPLIAKPDNGVGTSATYKLTTKNDVEEFKKSWNEEVVYFFEEFVEDGLLCTYDGFVDKNGEIVFETSFIYTSPTLELMKDSLDYANIISPKLDPKLEKLGRKIVAEFGMRERFFHIEFFKLEDGSYVALEYNNRIAGGTSVDLYNYAYDISLYDIYAKSVVGEKVEKISTTKTTLALSRRNRYTYKHSLDDIRTKYKEQLRSVIYPPALFATAMGDVIIIISVDSKKESEEALNFVHEKI